MTKQTLGDLIKQVNDIQTILGVCWRIKNGNGFFKIETRVLMVDC